MFKAPPQHITLMIFSFLLSAFSLGSIIIFTDPFQQSKLIKFFFYLSFFLLTLSLATIAGVFLRQLLWPKIYIINLSNSFRQAFLLSCLTSISAILLAEDLLFWWISLTLILFFASIEAFLNLRT